LEGTKRKEKEEDNKDRFNAMEVSGATPLE
jgi:hypothetical protein